ncbi:MAG TPA: DUF4136 domain-containing protein [Steroidobacteraceae bacterium]|nr:DUF4136 domain-containing protein [Steroidobacteraceae bacterium]
MDRQIVSLAAAAATLALAGCTGIPVRTDQNAQLVASVHCHTVAWAGGFKGASPLRNTIANPLNEARLRDAITANLQAAGIAIVEGSGANSGAQCLVGYGIGIERQIDTVYPEDWGYGPGFWGPGWWGPGWGWGVPYVYHQSFITVDLYDAASRKPMWHASAEQSLTGLSGDAATARIRAAVDAIFLKFPK